MLIEINTHYAYPDAIHLEAIMRFTSVKRWHMLDTVRIQTLAEHSAVVALLAHYIAKSAPRMFFGDADAITTPALLHDLPEVFTGDIPTPTKRHLGGLEELEDVVTPKEFQPTDLSYKVITLIKICDLAESMRFIRLHGNGTSISKHAEDGVQDQFRKWIRNIVAIEKWPMEVVTHTIGSAWFYAYETRDYFSERAFKRIEAGLDSDLARGQGNLPWST